MKHLVSTGAYRFKSIRNTYTPTRLDINWTHFTGTLGFNLKSHHTTKKQQRC